MDSIQLLASCSYHLPKIFASKMLDQAEKVAINLQRGNVADTQKLSVATKFKVLISLLAEWTSSLQ